MSQITQTAFITRIIKSRSLVSLGKINVINQKLYQNIIVNICYFMPCWPMCDSKISCESYVPRESEHEQPVAVACRPTNEFRSEGKWCKV